MIHHGYYELEISRPKARSSPPTPPTAWSGWASAELKGGTYGVFLPRLRLQASQEKESKHHMPNCSVIQTGKYFISNLLMRPTSRCPNAIRIATAGMLYECYWDAETSQASPAPALSSVGSREAQLCLPVWSGWRVCLGLSSFLLTHSHK